MGGIEIAIFLAHHNPFTGKGFGFGCIQRNLRALNHIGTRDCKRGRCREGLLRARDGIHFLIDKPHIESAVAAGRNREIEVGGGNRSRVYREDDPSLTHRIALSGREVASHNLGSSDSRKVEQSGDRVVRSRELHESDSFRDVLISDTHQGRKMLEGELLGPISLSLRSAGDHDRIGLALDITTA